MKAQLQIGNDVYDGVLEFNSIIFFMTFRANKNGLDVVVSFEKNLKSRDDLIDYFKSCGGVILEIEQ